MEWMMVTPDSDPPRPTGATAEDTPGRVLPAAAVRALAEAEARRAAAAKAAADAQPKELQGPSGPEPTRYGDWEKNGIASDF